MAGKRQKSFGLAGESRSSLPSPLGNAGISRHADSFDLTGWQIPMRPAHRFGPIALDLRFQDSEMEHSEFNDRISPSVDPRFPDLVFNHSRRSASALPSRNWSVRIRSQDAGQFVRVRIIPAGSRIS